MQGQSIDRQAIEAEIERIRSLGLEALRARWRSVFGNTAPPVLGRDLLARIISYRLQEEAFGGLDPATRKLLEGLARGEQPRSQTRRPLKPGTVLVREYQGARHTVTVVPDGFLWQGGTYSSLSTIARAITGTAWNGPRFFGVRVAGGDRTEDKLPAPTRKRSSSASLRASRTGAADRSADHG